MQSRSWRKEGSDATEGADKAMSTRVLVIDDGALFRRVISGALAGVPGVEMVGTASNGRLAMARMASLQLDLITLDIEMPEMNGIEVLEAMRVAGIKAGVIVLSALTVHGGEMTVHALELGAFDFLTKPEGSGPEVNLAHLRAHLLPMIHTFQSKREIRGILRGERLPARCEVVSPLPAPMPETIRRVRRNGSPLVLIGVSTGGPGALAQLVPALPADLGVPVFIVQHMHAMFTQPLAASLDKKGSSGESVGN
jgi:two-component system chemotaxis response regulator CheB